MKTCRVCKTEKPLAEYHNQKSSKDGKQSDCRTCKITVGKKYRQECKEAIAERALRRKVENPDRYFKNHANYRNRNRELIRERARVWAAKDYAENPSRNIATVVAWQKRNPEKVKAIEANRCPLKARIRADLRRSRIAETGGFYTIQEVKDLIEDQHGKCVYCKTDIREIYHIDHIVPVSKGGSSWPENLQILCPPCNLSKGAKCPIEFAQERGMLL